MIFRTRSRARARSRGDRREACWRYGTRDATEILYYIILYYIILYYIIKHARGVLKIRSSRRCRNACGFFGADSFALCLVLVVLIAGTGAQCILNEGAPGAPNPGPQEWVQSAVFTASSLEASNHLCFREKKCVFFETCFFSAKKHVAVSHRRPRHRPTLRYRHEPAPERTVTAPETSQESDGSGSQGSDAQIRVVRLGSAVDDAETKYEKISRDKIIYIYIYI